MDLNGERAKNKEITKSRYKRLVEALRYRDVNSVTQETTVNVRNENTKDSREMTM